MSTHFIHRHFLLLIKYKHFHNELLWANIWSCCVTGPAPLRSHWGCMWPPELKGVCHLCSRWATVGSVSPKPTQDSQIRTVSIQWLIFVIMSRLNTSQLSAYSAPKISPFQLLEDGHWYHVNSCLIAALLDDIKTCQPSADYFHTYESAAARDEEEAPGAQPWLFCGSIVQRLQKKQFEWTRWSVSPSKWRLYLYPDVLF